MSTYYYIYKTTNTTNNKIYVGSHCSDTLEFDGYYGSGQNIVSAVAKYGEKSFKREILEIVCFTENRLSTKEWYDLVFPTETKWIKFYSSSNAIMYNINQDAAFGGNTTGGTVWIHHPETKEHKMVSKECVPDGWVMGRTGAISPNIGQKLYTNSTTGEECYFQDTPDKNWSLGSSAQSKMRSGKTNPAHGKKWYQNKADKVYCYVDDGCPENFESGHPDWRHNKNWKNDGWQRV